MFCCTTKHPRVAVRRGEAQATDDLGAAPARAGLRQPNQQPRSAFSMKVECMIQPSGEDQGAVQEEPNKIIKSASHASARGAGLLQGNDFVAGQSAEGVP